MDHYDHSLLHASIPKINNTDDILDVPHPQVSSLLPSSSEPQLTQAQAASMRRRKNAEAQAAFRARRANYIASLEETVTSLEAVVLSLQDTCREARNDADDLRRENNRLTAAVKSLEQAARDRDKLWRESWQAKMQSLGFDDTQITDMPGDSRPFVDEMRFPQAQAQGGSSAQAYQLKDDSRYLPPFHTTATWVPGPFSATRTHSSASDSPPSLSPSVQYAPQPHSQSHSLDLNAYHGWHILFLRVCRTAYSGALITEYADANIHSSTSTERYDEERYRLRRTYSGPTLERANEGIYGAEADVSPLDDSPQAMRPRRHTTPALGQHPNPHSHSQSPSVSPPPGPQDRDPPISNTLAVIKAQAFGSLRRARTRSKRANDTASKTAIDLLSARGMGMGVPSPTRHPRKRGSNEMDNIEM
ncbi:hypothetical protein BU17DRAFT_93007 [Hysterangium stoloniferum]|nr:hypothetical protein BU17DRAFT_93007 [Hysterangium stoloniferum]